MTTLNSWGWWGGGFLLLAGLAWWGWALASMNARTPPPRTWRDEQVCQIGACGNAAIMEVEGTNDTTLLVCHQCGDAFQSMGWTKIGEVDHG